MDPSWAMWKFIWLENYRRIQGGKFGWRFGQIVSAGPQLGYPERNFGWKLRTCIPLGPSEGVLVDTRQGEVISEADGGDLGESVKWM